jgi:RNA polymerase sigma factor (sigma-70 family)
VLGWPKKKRGGGAEAAAHIKGDAMDIPAIVKLAMGCLTDKQRVVYEMYHFGKMSQKEISKKEGISQSEVSKKISRAEKRIKKRLSHLKDGINTE